MTRISEEQAISIIGVARARKKLKWGEVAEKLNLQFGYSFTAQGLSNKVNKGTIRFSLAMEILYVLEVDRIEIPDLLENLTSK